MDRKEHQQNSTRMKVSRADYLQWKWQYWTNILHQWAPSPYLVLPLSLSRSLSPPLSLSLYTNNWFMVVFAVQKWLTAHSHNSILYHTITWISKTNTWLMQFKCNKQTNGIILFKMPSVRFILNKQFMSQFIVMPFCVYVL